MGVINITPDSFSDGGKTFSSKNIQKQLEVLKSYNCDIVDFGAASTAPMNAAISIEQELERFQFLLTLDYPLDNFSQISMDTFHPEVMDQLLNHPLIKKVYDQGKLIWNDVSGCIDDGLISLLNRYPLLKYVYCHNEVPRRELSNSHMEYVKTTYDLNYYESFFKQSKESFILDPCFGFSKTRRHNLELLNKFPELMAKLNHEWVLGISRKSFLRFLDKDDPKLIFQTELMQVMHVTSLVKSLEQYPQPFQLILRMHDPLVFRSIAEFLEVSHDQQ